MITEIVYFNDYTLYSKCQMQAMKSGKKLNVFIVENCMKNLPPKEIKKNLEFWIACETEAKAKNCTVADFIEACCAHEIEALEHPTEVKRSFWDYFDLNYSQRRRK